MPMIPSCIQQATDENHLYQMIQYDMKNRQQIIQTTNQNTYPFPQVLSMYCKSQLGAPFQFAQLSARDIQ